MFFIIGKYSLTIFIAFSDNISENKFAFLDTYDSIACAKTSKPVSIDTEIGTVRVYVASTIFSPRIPVFIKLSEHVIIAPLLNSLPVPAVVGIAIIGNVSLPGVNPLNKYSSISLCEPIPTAIAFAASIALPPPKPITICILFVIP